MTLEDRLHRLADHIDAELEAAGTANAGGEPTAITLVASAAAQPWRAGVLVTATVAVLVAAVVAIAALPRKTDPTAAVTASGADAAPSVTTIPGPSGGAVAAERRPAAPTAFPVVDEQIAGATPAEATYSMQAWDNPGHVNALIALATDQSLTGGIRVRAVAGTRADVAAEFPTGTGPTLATTTTAAVVGQGQLWGHDVDVYTEPGTPTLHTAVVDAALPTGAVTLQFTGLDPLGVLSTVDQFVRVVPVPAAPDVGPPFTLEFVGPMPDGYQLVVPPSFVPNGAVDAILSVNSTVAVEGNGVEVSTANPLMAVAVASRVSAVEVNGVAGWMTDSPGHAVMWPVNAETFALVGGSPTAEQALALARSVRFVDEAAWQAHYQVAVPVFPESTDTSETTTTMITPIPASTG